MQADDLTETDKAILDTLHEGARTQGYIVDEIGKTRQQIYNRLNVLVHSGHVNKLHDATALYELVSDPRDSGQDT